jgi:hypothetical protein
MRYQSDGGGGESALHTLTMQRYKIFPNQQIKSQQITTNFEGRHHIFVAIMTDFQP